MKNKKNIKKETKKSIAKVIKENYIYFAVGILTFFIGVGIAAAVLHWRNSKSRKTVSISKTKQINATFKKKSSKKRIYVVKKGDYLWKIAEEVYGSGYNAIDITRVNHLKNPNLLFRGQKLVLPDVKPRKITRKMGSKGMKTQIKKVLHVVRKYKVQRGDYLWKIALKTYGDGFMWVKIARANHLKNPNLIYRGQVLTLP